MPQPDRAFFGALHDAAAAVITFPGIEQDRGFPLLRAGDEDVYLADLNTAVAPNTEGFIKAEGFRAAGYRRYRWNGDFMVHRALPSFRRYNPDWRPGKLPPHHRNNYGEPFF